MDYTQLIPFDPSKGGNVPNLCLANVSAGYSIGNKYASAWEAWQNTQQHPDRNIPAGLAVPIFYSYTTTIDGVTQNYGHINVQLPDGSVWSDGNMYASIDAYMANHAPRFVGWGESVNDFKIIGEDDMTSSEAPVDETAVKQCYDGLLLRDALPNEIAFRVNAKQTQKEMMSDLLASDEHKAIIDKVASSTASFVPYAGQALYTKK